MSTHGRGEGRSREGDGAWALAVSVRLEHDGPEMARESVTGDDLVEARSEVWLEGCLREGRPGIPLDALRTRVVPVRRDGEAGFSGYALETTDPAGRVSRRDFTVRSLHHVASRAAQRLISGGSMAAGDLYYYEIVAQSRAPGEAPVPAAGPSLTVEARSRPLEVLRVPLEALLRRSELVGPPADGFHPVLYTEEAFAKAERFSRRGAASHPPEETGGVILGVLCSCPESGELFVVVSDVLEATDAERSKFSLSYSSRTWARIQAVVDRIRSRPATRGIRIVGQSHGHNFLPADGAPPCEVCPKVKVCGRTSVFVSTDDLAWSRAVFARQPWKLCHIFGLNARKEEVQGLFGLRDGRLLERGFRTIPEFDPADWAGGEEAPAGLASPERRCDDRRRSP